ncbi:hypothetical protein FOYG_16958 [Fusarium oxysporum NRRL 32931]|uniref:Major facilitator superfamily (MFS) profile domain-containing protein n=1 Tax=Fusarium oxysporum NRRL 32931 TaxID=660029 RepID=W9HBI9_FUSOX|nr:hypothetical protein FOYG_16958 [Fusarium oxysporum NRRL 32931]
MSNSCTRTPVEPLTSDTQPESAPNHSDDSDNQQGLSTSHVEKAKGLRAPGSEAPDGGIVAWLVVLGVWCTIFCSSGWLNIESTLGIGVFQEYYQNDLLSDYNPSTVAWIPSLQIFFMFGMGPIVGSLYDRFGHRWLILGGSLLHVFGIMMTSLSTEYYQILLAQGVCSALGVSAIFQPSLACIHGWFDKKRGTAFGIVTTGSSVGGVIFPIMVTRLISKVGFAWSMRIGAFVVLFLLIIANLTIRAYTTPHPQNRSLAQLRRPFMEVEFVFVAVGFLFLTYGIFVPLDYLSAQALDAGMDPNLSQYLIPVLNAASLFGRLSAGSLADRFGKYNMFIASCCLSGIWVLGLWIPIDNDQSLIAFAILFGFCSGAYVSLISPLIAQISPMSEIGLRTGLAFFLASIGGLTTSPISGAILDGASGWTGVKTFSGVLCMAGTGFVFAARIHRTGWKLGAAV